MFEFLIYGGISVVIGFIVLLVIWSLAFEPIWKVWASRKYGEAQYQEAINKQRVQVAAAQGRLDAAELNKKAAIIEAEAVAKQVETIGKELQQHDLYLRWQWIKMMEHRSGSTVYVPTEANLPILEAGKRQ